MIVVLQTFYILITVICGGFMGDIKFTGVYRNQRIYLDESIYMSFEIYAKTVCG